MRTGKEKLGGQAPLISLLPLGEGLGKRGVAEARSTKPLRNPLPKGEGAKRKSLRQRRGRTSFP